MDVEKGTENDSTPITAIGSSRYIAAISDDDFLASTYEDGKLPTPTVGDKLSILTLPLNGKQETIAQINASNSVTGAPYALALSRDGRNAFVVETLGVMPVGARCSDSAARLKCSDSATVMKYLSWRFELAEFYRRDLLITYSCEQTIKRWSPKTGQCLQNLQAHLNRVWAVTFSPDIRWLATGGDDRTVKLWDIATGHCLRTFEGHTSQGCLIAVRCQWHNHQSVGS